MRIPIKLKNIITNSEYISPFDFFDDISHYPDQDVKYYNWEELFAFFPVIFDDKIVIFEKIYHRSIFVKSKFGCGDVYEIMIHDQYATFEDIIGDTFQLNVNQISNVAIAKELIKYVTKTFFK